MEATTPENRMAYPRDAGQKRLPAVESPPISPASETPAIERAPER